MAENSCIVSLYFCTRNPPRYGDRVERTRDKEAYKESRTAREEPCCMLHRRQKQRRGEEIANSPNAGSWLLSDHGLRRDEDIKHAEKLNE